jgi:hypothetical protein
VAHSSALEQISAVVLAFVDSFDRPPNWFAQIVSASLTATHKPESLRSVPVIERSDRHRIAAVPSFSGSRGRISGDRQMVWLLALATTAAAVRSAWYWYRSSQVVALPDWEEVGREPPTDPLQFQLGWMSALMKAGGEAAALNRWGAIWTAGTVALGAATTLVHAWSG